ncbi:MAG TPA: glutaredoxin family protein [Actinomycetota bacterium]|jgi:glutaredoxin|nr:glutaredoxin family protein [Actinomycetota bacterium]
MQVVLYSRAACHLCDDAREVLVAEQARTPFDLVEVDIDSSDDLVREYGVRIPVVVVDGVEAFEYSVDPAELAAVLRAAERL